MTKFLSFMRDRQDLILIALLMVSVTVMIIPLPTLLMDLLIGVNIAFTMLILVVAVYVKRPEEFTAFPAIILITTMFRLALTISTTRLILLAGDAGDVIDAFGNFVVRGNFVVGARHLPHPHHGPVHRHRQGLRARGRSGRPLHPRRHARQADVHRRRHCAPAPSTCETAQAQAPRPRAREPALRRHGRRHEVRQGRRHRRHHHHRHQHRRRPRHRRAAEGHAHRSRAQPLFSPDRRRRPHRPDPRPYRCAVRRHHHHPRQQRQGQ